MALGRSKFLELRKYAEEGNWSWRVLGFIAGLLVMWLSIMSILTNLISLSPFRAVLNIYLFFFGLAACLLEFKERTLTVTYLTVLQREALFLTRPYGRAAFYFFLGLLIVSIGGLLNLIVGAYVTGLGLVVYYSSTQAYTQLNTLKASLTEKQVEEKFYAFDKDRSNSLSVAELGALCASLGAHMNAHQLESALFILDKNGDGLIALEEFKRWWNDRQDFFV